MANEKTVKTRLQIKRGSTSDWNKATNPTEEGKSAFAPLDGELIYYTDTNVLKIGKWVQDPAFPEDETKKVLASLEDAPVLADGTTAETIAEAIEGLNYAGASANGGPALQALSLVKEGTTAGTFEPNEVGGPQSPVYFNDEGIPTECSALPYAAKAANSTAAAGAEKLVGTENGAEIQLGDETTPVFIEEGIPKLANLVATAAVTTGDRPAVSAMHILKPGKYSYSSGEHGVGNSQVPIYIDSYGVPQQCGGIINNDVSGNAATATKLQKPTTFGVTGAATATSFSFDGSPDDKGNSRSIDVQINSVKEAYLTWGGKNIAGGVTPVDAAASSLHSANRFAFADPTGISIKYSQAGGNFSDYSISVVNNASKTKLVSGLSISPIYAGNRSSSNAVNDKVQIELNSKTMGVYTLLRKLLINVSKAYCTASVTVQSVTFGGTSSTLGTYNLVGWSGWNSIPMGSMYFGYSSGSTSNIEKLILTFSIDKLDAGKTTNYLGVLNIIAIGETDWTTPSTLARTGHMYEYDVYKNVTFPGKVITTGGFEGLATRASGLYGTFPDPTDPNETKTDLFTVGDADEPVYFQNGIPVKGKRIPNILTGTTAPTASLGQNGDIYLMPYANNMPAIYSGTAAPASTLGVDGDIYILYE